MGGIADIDVGTFDKAGLASSSPNADFPWL